MSNDASQLRVTLISRAWLVARRNPASIAIAAMLCVIVVLFVTNSRARLELTLEPFIETIDQRRNELGQITDFSTSNTPADTPKKPRFDLRGYRVLTLEATGTVPFNDIVFLYHWYDKAGVALGLRDSYHMLRVAHDADVLRYVRERDGSGAEAESRPFIDTFTGIPSRQGATSTAFLIQYRTMLGGSTNVATKLALYGHDVTRARPVEPGFAVQTSEPGYLAADAATHDVTLGAIAAKNIIGRGVHIHIPRAAAVTHVRANHELQTTTEATEFVIGAMQPQVVAYKTSEGEDRTLYFANADLIEVVFDPAKAEILVDVYDYEFRERTTRSTTRYPDAKLQRVHPNLGVVDKLPRGRLTVTHSRSNTLAFPLWQPNGFLATVAITEHADYVGVEQDKLTMYGGDAEVVAAGAGILGNRIPLTKTVFALGPELRFRNSTASSGVVGPFARQSIGQSQQLLDQLRKYKAAGYDVEIGAHCILGDLRSSAHHTFEHFDRALAHLAEFAPVTWVDHGGPECLWESGWDPTSKYYVVPLLKKYGFRYLNALGDKYDGRLNMIANNEPSNLLFYSVGLDDDTGDEWQPIFFSTVPLQFNEDNLTTAHVRDIVNARGLINIHTYLPYESLRFEKARDGSSKLALNPWYNTILANLATANRNGDVHLATTKRLNDYMWKVKGLTYYASGETVHVGHPDGTAIKGLTIAVRNLAGDDTTKVVISGTTPLGERSRDGVRYIWFDLPARVR